LNRLIPIPGGILGPVGIQLVQIDDQPVVTFPLKSGNLVFHLLQHMLPGFQIQVLDEIRLQQLVIVIYPWFGS
jgi:hypothetical protein